jgi:hypothetical protein
MTYGRYTESGSAVGIPPLHVTIAQLDAEAIEVEQLGSQSRKGVGVPVGS